MNTTREARVQTAGALRAAGKTYREIGDELGVSPQTIIRWLDPDADRRSREKSAAWKAQNREANRARDRRYGASGACSQCGGRAWRKSDLCQACFNGPAEARRRTIESMWAEGHTAQRIADALGMTKHDLGIEVATMRRQPDRYNVPHRRTPEQVERIKAGWARVRRAA